MIGQAGAAPRASNCSEMAADKTATGMLALCTAILVGAALYLGRSIFAPVAFSIFAIAIVWPLQSALQRKAPKLVALLLTVVVTLTVLTLLALGIAWGTSQIGHWFLGNLDRFQLIYASSNKWLEEHGIFVTEMLVDRFDVAWLVRFAQQVGGRLNSLMGFALLVFAFTVLGIVEIEQLNARVKKVEERHSN